MLVLNINPCMCQFSIEQRNCEWLIKTVIVYSIVHITWITVVILELIHAQIPDARMVAFIRFNHHMVNHSNLADRV